MKKIFICAVKLCISGAISLAFLSLFCLVFDYTGCHIKNSDGSTDYKWENNQRSSTMKEGVSWFRFDRNGFNNINDASFEEQPIDILLMGSSHMEARQIGKDENVGALLNQYLSDLRTYNIGVSGHNIYTSVKNMDTACEIYAPQRYVILETDNIVLSEGNMQQVMKNEYPEIPSYDSGLVYYMQKNVPAIKSLYKALTEWRSISEWRSAVKTVESEEKLENDAVTNNYEKELNRFLYHAKSSIPNNCTLIIFYHPPTAIDEYGELIVNVDSKYLNLFKMACEANGIIFVDETEDFIDSYEDENILAHGFINTAVGSGHLNKYGHQVIADHLIEVIREDLEGRR